MVVCGGVGVCVCGSTKRHKWTTKGTLRKTKLQRARSFCGICTYTVGMDVMLPCGVVVPM